MDLKVPDNNYTYSKTKQKILMCAVELFSTKGYTETSVRDIAAAVGIKSASLYNHFLSKEDLLEFMLNDYSNNTRILINNPELPVMLKKNHTAEGIMNCMPSKFFVLTDDYYLKVLHVIFHEQHRNDHVRNLVVKVIMDMEEFVEIVFAELKKLKVIRHDADSDFWKKAASSLIYTLPNRRMLGIGQDSEAFPGMDLEKLLHYLFDLVLKIYGVMDK